MVLKNSERGWKTLGRNKAERIYSILREVRETATMKNAAFGAIGDKELTPMIRKETDLWRRSWILSPLDRVIEELKETYKFRV